MTLPQDTIPDGSRALRFGVVGAAVLVIAGCVTFYFASANKMTGASKDSATATVTLRDGRCDPTMLKVPEGRSTFRVVNETDRIAEWEILDGVMVLAERENIPPGMSQTVGARLFPGNYTITCGLLSNPRGSLEVLSAGSAGGRPSTDLVAFVGPLAEYQFYLSQQANALVGGATALQAALSKGDLTEARRLYVEARQPWSRISPVTDRFADLGNTIDPVAAYLQNREDDEAFTGFHRIEYGVFRKNDASSVAASATKLVADATALRDRLKRARLGPDDIIEGTVRRLRHSADTGIPNGENLYAGSDLFDLAAEVQGVRKVLAVLRPVAVRTAQDAVAAADTRLQEVEKRISSFRGESGYLPFASVDADSRVGLSEDVTALADAVERLGVAARIDQIRSN